MPNGEHGGVEGNAREEGFEPNSDVGSNCSSRIVFDPLQLGEKGGGAGLGSTRTRPDGMVTPPPTITIVIAQPEEVPNPKSGILRSAVVEGGEKVGDSGVSKKGFLPRTESNHEQCRVCQEESEEPLVDLGCRCRGDLAKAHRSCIDIWFRTRGSNKCEICQQVAANIPAPESQPSRCCNPLWVAFAILIGGLLLDVLISVSLGVSALPVNIIIGVLIVLGLGTALRLGLECCHQWSSRRSLQRLDMTITPGYHPAV
ncbi:uncharacterized protein [Typha angustifolia]|uniref:uncharacterized protein isoform X2 n=1 Tax=Typha angustifolia TaxID=59011 RepID=UPI003C2C80C5